MLQKSQDIHKISFAFEFYNKDNKKVLTLVMMRGDTLCTPKVFLFFYQKSLQLNKSWDPPVNF